MPNKVLDFNWRIFHGQIVTEKRLQKMNLSNGMCTLCKSELEDITHLFAKCSYFKKVWNWVEYILEKFGIPTLKPK